MRWICPLGYKCWTCLLLMRGNFMYLFIYLSSWIMLSLLLALLQERDGFISLFVWISKASSAVDHTNIWKCCQGACQRSKVTVYLALSDVVLPNRVVLCRPWHRVMGIINDFALAWQQSCFRCRINLRTCCSGWLDKPGDKWKVLVCGYAAVLYMRASRSWQEVA